MVGTCASKAAPTTSPTVVAFRRVLVMPTVGREHRVLDVGVEVERPGSAFAADAGLTVAAKGGTEVAHEEAVNPDGAGVQQRRNTFCPFVIACDEGGRQAEPGVVGHGDCLLFGAERLDG